MPDKRRQFEIKVTCRIELTTTIVVAAADEDLAVTMVEDLITRGEAGFSKIEVKCPDGWDFVDDETDVELVGEEETE